MRFRLNEERAQHLVRSVGAVPNTVSSHKNKTFSLQVICAEDYPHRITKFEDLHLDLLRRKVYANMKPLSLFSGEFEVAEGYEERFRAIAREHGFNAMQTIEVM